MKKVIACFIIAVLILAGGIGYSIYYGSSKDELYRTRKEEFLNLQNKLDTMKKQISDKRVEIHEAVFSDVDSDRKNNDDILIIDMIKDMFDWDSYDSYMKKRNEICKTYKLPESSQFLSIFMSEPLSIKNDFGDVVWNAIDDEGLNMSYNSLTSHIESISDDGTWSYIAEVSFSVSDTNGYVSDSKAYIRYSIRDRIVTNIEGYVDGYDVNMSIDDKSSDGVDIDTIKNEINRTSSTAQPTASVNE